MWACLSGMERREPEGGRAEEMCVSDGKSVRGLRRETQQGPAGV